MEIYGDLTTTGLRKHNITPAGRKMIMEECICICNKIKFYQRQHLRSGASRNCGCKNAVRIAKLGKENAKHGMEGTHPYKKYMAAKSRCDNIKNDSYKSYGARGIKMEWRTFKSFWDDMGPGYYGHIEKYGINETTLDRINVNGNYCKENCRWATWREQNSNKTNSHYIEYRGETLTISEMAKKYSLSKGLLRDRITRQGWSVSDAIEIPKIPKKKYI